MTTPNIHTHITAQGTTWTSTRLDWCWEPTADQLKMYAKRGYTPDLYMYLHQNIDTSTGEILETYMGPLGF